MFKGEFMTTYYTMIGSRSTPSDVISLMGSFAEKSCHFGYIGRSGGANGADTCLEMGVERFLSSMNYYDNLKGNYQEIYLPWKDFNGRYSDDSGYYTLPFMTNKGVAENIASKVHPAWERCKQGAKKLHTRNVYQLLGQDLKTPSRFIICWAEPKYLDRRSEEVKGGTGTAVKLGIDNGVEIINLYWEDQRKRVSDWVNKPLTTKH